MWTFEHSVVTRARRSDAWRYWTDMDDHARMEPAVERIELGGPFATGTRGRSVGPGFRQEWTLSDVVGAGPTVRRGAAAFSVKERVVDRRSYISAGRGW